MNDGVIVDARVDKDAAYGSAFVEAVYTESLGRLVLHAGRS